MNMERWLNLVLFWLVLACLVAAIAKELGLCC